MIVHKRHGTDKINRFGATFGLETPIPVLALLTQIDRVKKVGTRTVRNTIGHCSKVRDGKLFLRGFIKEEVANRRIGCSPVCFKLLQSRTNLSVDPVSQPWKTARQFVRIPSGSLSCPLKQPWFDFHAHCHLFSIAQSDRRS